MILDDQLSFVIRFNMISLAIFICDIVHILIMSVVRQKRSSKSGLDFQVRATAALGLSIVVDALDYVGAPIFALPVIGDIADVIVMATLYRLTGSKTSAAVNSIELIPFIGDMLPTYTISTLLWIIRESVKRKGNDRLESSESDQADSITRINDPMEQTNIVDLDSITTRQSLRTKARRRYVLFRSR